MTETYNGWKNYETWAVKLWIDNDESTSNYWIEQAERAYKNADATENWTRKESASYKLSDLLKSEIEEQAPQLEGMFADLLNAAIGEVSWDEIAENMIENISDDIDADEKCDAEESK